MLKKGLFNDDELNPVLFLNEFLKRIEIDSPDHFKIMFQLKTKVINKCSDCNFDNTKMYCDNMININISIHVNILYFILLEFIIYEIFK